MNKLLSISLIVLIIGVPFKDLLIYTYYNLDKDFISTVLCINKENPNSNCHGKCFLNKKIEESHQSDQSPRLIEKKTNMNWLNLEIEALKIPDLTIAKREFVKSKTMHSILFKNRIFQPPRQF